MNKLSMIDPNELFSLYQFFPDGSYERLLHHVDIELALNTAASYASRPAAMIGIIQRLIITDAGDSIVFEWRYKYGVVFPIFPPKANKTGE